MAAGVVEVSALLAISGEDGAPGDTDDELVALCEVFIIIAALTAGE